MKASLALALSRFALLTVFWCAGCVAPTGLTGDGGSVSDSGSARDSGTTVSQDAGEGDGGDVAAQPDAGVGGADAGGRVDAGVDAGASLDGGARDAGSLPANGFVPDSAPSPNSVYVVGLGHTGTTFVSEIVGEGVALPCGAALRLQYDTASLHFIAAVPLWAPVQAREARPGEIWLGVAETNTDCRPPAGRIVFARLLFQRNGSAPAALRFVPGRNYLLNAQGQFSSIAGIGGTVVGP